MSDEQIGNSRQKQALPLWAVALLAISVLIILIVSGLWIYKAVTDLVSSNVVTDYEPNPGDNPTDPNKPNQTSDSGNTNSSSNSDKTGKTTPVAGAEEDPNATANNFILPTWEGKERINMLLMGIDLRCDEEGATHTDSMMLVSVDPVNYTAVALSLPRDTWVEIPTFGPDRINNAHYLGEISEYPGGGTGLAMQTVSNFLGIKIDDYITVNFQGFRDFINLIDGIELNVPEEIDDPTYPDECYGYDGFHVDAGVQNMNGPIALKYARTRATANGDIDRAGRQQAVMLAVRDKLMQFNMIPYLLPKAPSFWKTFQGNIKTSFTDKQLFALAMLVTEIEREDITTAVIDYNYLYNESTTDGRMVLVPNYDAIRELRESLFAPVTPPTPMVKNLGVLMKKEKAEILLLNGTQTSGLAGTTRDYLQSKGFTIAEVGNANSSQYATSQIIDYGNHTNTVLYLNQLMGLPPLSAEYSDQPADYDITVIIGADWELPTDTGEESTP